jgi:CheY-like chemotaxis protein
MKKIVLLIEDLKKEQKKAKKVIAESDFKVAVAGNLKDAYRLWEKLEGKIAGILTDLHFPENENGKDNNPNGLVVVTQALLKNIPVAVCSDVDKHFCLYVKDLIDNLKKLTRKKIFLDLDKNWEQAVNQLKEMIGGK